jgi:hypothetical protein
MLHHLAKECLHVVAECILPFVQEDSRRRVERLQVNQAIANTALSDDLIHTVGDIQQLHPFSGDPVDNPTEDPVTDLDTRPASVGFDRDLGRGFGIGGGHQRSCARIGYPKYQ